MKRLSLLSAALMASPAFAATPTTWTTTIDAATYGSTGTISFNDHGYVGPNGVGASDFQVGSGFDASRVGQIQTVVTKDPDGLTSDASKRIVGDYGAPDVFTNANMDGQVNFYRWGYTTVGGSTFNNMTIDKAGNYFVARNDMAFQYTMCSSTRMRRAPTPTRHSIPGSTSSLTLSPMRGGGADPC